MISPKEVLYTTASVPCSSPTRLFSCSFITVMVFFKDIIITVMAAMASMVIAAAQSSTFASILFTSSEEIA